MASASAHSIDGASVVITHRVPGDKHDEYARWLDGITPLCRASGDDDETTAAGLMR